MTKEREEQIKALEVENHLLRTENTALRDRVKQNEGGGEDEDEFASR